MSDGNNGKKTQGLFLKKVQCDQNSFEYTEKDCLIKELKPVETDEIKFNKFFVTVIIHDDVTKSIFFGFIKISPKLKIKKS